MNRLHLLLLAALALAAGPAAAETGGVDLELEAIPAPIPPLETVTAQAAVRIDCRLLSGAEPSRLTLSVTDAPPWVQAVLSPPEVEVTREACTTPTDRVRVPAELRIVPSLDAPAFTPASLEVTASVAGPEGAASAASNVTVRADFFGILNAHTDTPAQVGRPQSTLVFPVVLQNLGNADVKVTFEVLDNPAGWTVVPPPQVTLQSKQTGGQRTQDTVNVQVQTPAHNGYVNEITEFTLRVRSHHALDADLEGDEALLTLQATARGAYAPAPALPLVLAGLAGVGPALTRRAR